MSAIENRLFSPSPTRNTAPPVPGRGIAQTLQAVRKAPPGTEPRVAGQHSLMAPAGVAGSMRWVSRDITPSEMNALAGHVLPADLYDSHVRLRPAPMAFLQSLPAEWPLITSLAMDLDRGRVIEVGMNCSVRQQVPLREDMSIYTAGLSTCTGVAVLNVGEAGVDVMLGHYDHAQIHKLKQDVSQAASTFAQRAGKLVLIACVPESGNKAVSELQASFRTLGHEAHIHTYPDELAVDATRSRALIVHVQEGNVSIDGMLQRTIGGDRSRGTIAHDAARDTSPSRNVRFIDAPDVGSTAGSWQAASSRVAVDFRALSKVLPVLDSGSSISNREVRKLLLLCLAANVDHGVVSPKSEKLLLRALDEVSRSTQHSSPAGSLPFEVLHSFITHGQRTRPDLFE